MSVLDVILAVIAGVLLLDVGIAIGRIRTSVITPAMPHTISFDKNREIKELHVGPDDTIVLATDAKLGQEEVQRIAQKFLCEDDGSLGLPLVMDRGLHIDCVIKGQENASAAIFTQAGPEINLYPVPDETCASPYTFHSA